MKKFLSLLMALAIVCSVTVSICSAVTPRSTSVPTATWDIETQGTYTFSGHTNNETLYTNYRFTGCDSYTITITNSDDHDQIVRVRRASDGKELKEFSVPAGEEDYVYTFDTSNVWYLEFYSNEYFNGKGCTISGTIESAD